MRAAALLALLAAGAPAGAFEWRFADPMPGAPAAASLALRSVKAPGVLVHHDEASEPLAREIARTLGAMYAEAHRVAGVPLAVYGLVLVSDRSALPPPLRDAHWINVGGIPCLTQASRERALPLEDEGAAYMIFPFLVHESVDVGIKRALFGGRLTQETVSSRWWVEGVAEHAAYRACSLHLRRSCSGLLRNYHGQLAAREGALDLEDPGTWWPKPGALPQDVIHAYAAAHYVVAKEAERSGEDWPRRAFALLRPNPTSLDLSAALSSLTGHELRPRVRRVELLDVRAYFPKE